jgi:hypothetical protein
MKPFLTITAALLLVACATPSTPYQAPDVGQAQATYSAAAQQAQLAANAATAQAGQATAVAAQATAQAMTIANETAIASTAVAATATAGYEATAGNLAILATSQAIAANATGQAIAASGTGTAVAQAAQLEAYLIADEATRIAQVREAERIANQRAERWNAIWPWLAVAVIVAVLAIAGAIAHAYWRRSQVNIIRDENNRSQLIVYGGEVRALPRREIPALLPAPREETTAGPVPLPPLTTGHILIAGETGSGKSTAMLAALKRRRDVVVLDPHDAPGTWGNARVIGGGRNFEAIGEYMNYMRHVLQKRYEQRGQGVSNFEPLTVATDEMPAIVSRLGRDIADTWREWLREGRKVGLFFVVSTQSTRVKTLGIEGEGDLLENFRYILVLGQLAQNQYPDLAQGMERPAVLRTLGGIQPVTIPYEPASPETAVQPLFTAPELSGLNTQWGTITPYQVARILDLKRAGRSNAYIETEVFDQDNPGGVAYYKVKAVLDAFYVNGGNGHSVE